MLRSLAALLAVVCLFAAGCSSTATARRAPQMPFHVAVAPIQVQREPRARTAAGDESLYEVELDAAQATRLLVDELREHVFVRVTELPDSSGAQGASLAEREQRQLSDWLRGAQAIKADLLLISELRYVPEIQHEIETTPAILNGCLFLFAPPFSYCLDDHRYRVEASLSGQLLELANVNDVAQLQKAGALAVMRAQYAGASRDFIDRFDELHQFAYTLVCPPTFLGRESESVARELDREVLAELARAGAQQLAGDERAVLRPDVAASFFVPAKLIVARHYSDGLMALDVPVYVPDGGPAAKLTEYVVHGGGKSLPGLFGDPVAADVALERETERLAHYQIAVRIDEFDPAVRELQVEVYDELGNVRTFSTVVEPVAASSPIDIVSAKPAVMHRNWRAVPVEAAGRAPRMRP